MRDASAETAGVSVLFFQMEKLTKPGKSYKMVK